MIERKFVADNVKEFQIKEFVKKSLGRVGLSDVRLRKTPMGEKIIIATSRPGLVVGRSGSNISRVTRELKAAFDLENPQIEIEEVLDIGLDANIIAEMIAGSLERFGSQRFKGVGHKAMQNVISSGAYGVEILISGKIPSSRAKTWRFYQGYLKKCGDLSVSGVLKAYSIAKLKTGIVGIKVSIMPGTIKLPDRITLVSEIQEVVEEVKGEEAEVVKEEIKEKVSEKKSEAKKEVKEDVAKDKKESKPKDNNSKIDVSDKKVSKEEKTDVKETKSDKSEKTEEKSE